MVDKTVVHFEIPAEEVEKLKSFYEGVFNWKITHTPVGPMDYWLIETVPINEKGEPIRPGVNGGIYRRENPQQTPTNYISVDDIDSHISKLKELGGTLVQDKSHVPGVGYIAVGLDPEGNQIGMLQGEM